jgi:hypothetical protein
MASRQEESLLPKLMKKQPAPQGSDNQDLLSVLKKPKTGLAKLMDTLKTSGTWEHLLAVGIDLETLGWPLDQPEPLWTVMNGPNIYHPVLNKASEGPRLPECYTVPNLAPPGTKLHLLKEDTLLYTFYGFPHHRLQELAAKELTHRNWRYLVKDKLWAVNMSSPPKDSSPHSWFTFTHVWDPQSWSLAERHGKVPSADVEDRFLKPVF